MTSRDPTPSFYEQPELPLRNCLKRTTGFSLPLPLDTALNMLQLQAESAGEQTTRSEIISALVAMACQLDGEGVSELVHDYRRTRVIDVIESPPMH